MPRRPSELRARVAAPLIKSIRGLPPSYTLPVSGGGRSDGALSSTCQGVSSIATQAAWGVTLGGP